MDGEKDAALFRDQLNLLVLFPNSYEIISSFFLIHFVADVENKVTACVH